MKEESQAIKSAIGDYNLPKDSWTTYYVDPDGYYGYAGDDNNSGETWMDAVATIQAAIDLGYTGTKIIVAPATYAETLTCTMHKLWLLGVDRESVILNVTAANTFSGNQLVLEGLTIYDNTNSGTTLFEITGDDAYVRNCNLDSGSAGGNGILLAGARNIIDNLYSIDAKIGYAIEVQSGNYHEIKNCQLSNVATCAVTAGSLVYSRIHDNIFIDCVSGVELDALCEYNDIYHNNFISNTTNITNLGSNYFFENFYSTYTDDYNNDGLCDAEFNDGGTIDPRPVSKPFGWNSASLGATQGNRVRRFFSSSQAAAILDTTGTTDVALPSVTLPAAGSTSLPSGATILAVYAIFLYGSRKDTSGSDNAINGDQYIQAKEHTAGSYTNAILIEDNTMPIDVSEATVYGGTAIFGNINISTEVSTLNKTYDFQWTNCKVDGNNMILADIQTVLEVHYVI